MFKQLQSFKFLLLIPLLFVLGASAQVTPVQAQSGTNCASVSEIPTAECEALVAFYTSTNGPSWTENGGWLSNNNPCSWEGVDCDEERVSRLFQAENGLSGTLPAELSDLTALTWLQLNNNQIGGAIPSGLANLDQMIWLRLEDNALTGGIPAGLGSMTALEYLYLGGNRLSGTLPAELGSLSQMKKLYLDGNQLSGQIPAEFGNLSQLQAVIFSQNNFSGSLPSSFTNLSNLTYLHYLQSGLCTPGDSAFQTWLAGVDGVYGPEETCAGEQPSNPTPTPQPEATPANTPNPLPTPTVEPLPTLAPVAGGTNLCQGLVVDQENRPMQPLAKPGYLQTVVDPAFGTTIRRISDVEATVTGERAVIKPMYNTIQAWNADESYLILYQRSAGHLLHDGFTYEFIRNLDIFPADLEEVFWDFNDPDILYYVEPYRRSDEEPGKRLIRYSVSNDSKTSLRSFDNVCTSSGIESGNDVQMMSWDSDTIGLRCSSEPAQLFGYKISTDTLTPILTSGVGNNYAPWYAPQPAPSGDLYVLDNAVLDTNMNVLRTLNFEGPEHSVIGQFRDGTDGVFAVAFAEGPQGGCGAGSLIAHDLTDGSCRTLVGQENGYPYPPSDTHMSALSHLNPGWIAVSGVGVANWGQTENAGQELLDNELLLVDSAPGGDVCRVGHHRSFADGGSFGYWSEPHVVISPSGTRLLFGSDWEGGSSVDSYVIELPSYQGPDGINQPNPTATPIPQPTTDPTTLPVKTFLPVATEQSAGSRAADWAANWLTWLGWAD